MKKYRIMIIALLIFAIGIASWSLLTRKSLDQLKQHAVLVRADTVKEYAI